jgi:ABC-type multidrug transport system fused ATPase/permease subunit
MPNYFVSAILDFLKQNPVWPIITIVTIIITNPVEMIVSSKLTEKFIESVKEKPNMRYLWWIIAMTLASNMTHSLQEVIEAHYITKMQQEIRMDLLSKISTKQEFNYETMDGGDTITNIKSIPPNVSNFVDCFTAWVITPVINLGLIGAYLVRINAPLGLKIMGILITFMAFNFAVLRSVPQEAQNQEVEEAVLINQIDDTLNNTLSIMMCNYTNQEMAAIDTQHARFNTFMSNNLQKRAYGTILTGLTIVIALALIVWLTFQAYRNKVVSKSNMIVMLLLSISLVRMIRHYSNHMVQAFLEYAKLIKHDAFIRGLAHKTVPDGVETGAIHGNIVFKRVSYAYEGTDRKSLDNVSFKIRARDRVAIVGSSGSGKTTILKLIMGFGTPSDGAVLIDGHSVRDMRRKHLRKHISLVPQNIKLFNRSIMENICYGSPDLDPERVKNELKNLHVMRAFNALPDGLDSVVGKNGDKLSGGQKQIVYLLRCYFRRTPIVLMDEPTSALDGENAKYVRRMIDAMSRHATLIVVTHDPSFAATFPVRMQMQNGRLVHHDSYTAELDGLELD